MPVSPQDFALWSRITGNPYPQTPTERMALAPQVYEFNKTIGRRGGPDMSPMRRAVDVVGDFVEWDSSGGTARGRIEHVMREGVLGIPDSTFSITAEEGDPAVLIRVYRELRDGYVATETLVGHKASELRSIAPLKEPSDEANRKISLRLAQAIINNTK